MDSYEEFHQAASKNIEKQRETGIPNSHASWRYSIKGDSWRILADDAELLQILQRILFLLLIILLPAKDFSQKVRTLLQRILTCLYLQPRWSLHPPANFVSSQKGSESQHKVHHRGKVKKTTPNSKLPTLCLTANKQTSKQTSKQASTFSSTDKTQVP
jgi:hypothetical protein